MECRKGQKRLLAVKVAVLVGLAAGVASAATMTQLVNGPSDIRVAPLVQASWAQGDVNGSPCYNSKTPNNYVCGCVATAAGQIMRKWQYPAAAPARVTNGDCKIDGTTTSQTMRGGPDVPYEWTNMPLAPAVDGESLSAAQREAIGTLLYDIGVATGMNWRNDGASTSTSILAGQFTSTFGYANAAIAGNPSGTGLSLEQFKQAVLPCLDAGMPVVVGIGGANTSHSVVCDGYGYQDGDLYIHLNMGNAVDSDSSADYNNTWYKFPTNNPEGNDVSLWSGGEQSYLNPVVYNISPTMQKGWSIVSGRILSGGNAVEGAEVVAVNASGEGVATAASNAKGIYALALPAGTYTLRAVDSDETKGARVSVTVVATEGTARSDGGAENVVIGNQHGVDISLAEIGSDFLADETPDAYIDYVESSGSQYIDTGVRGRAGTKADMNFMVLEAKESWFMGSRKGSSGNYRLFFCYLENGTDMDIGYGNTWYATYWGYVTGKPYSLQVEFTADGVVKATRDGSPANDKTAQQGTVVDTECNLYLFACNVSGTATKPASARCYGTKIWQTDESGAYKLVRDFVPCKKGGRAALYDKVTRTIFYSRSGTDLLASDYTISTVGQPDAYLDYVESDGNQYIDTGVEGRRGVKAMMDVAWTGFVDETYQEILGAASSDWRCNLCDLYGAMPSYSYGENWGTFDSGLTSGRTIDTVYHVITEAAAKEVLTINGYTGVRNTASEVPENFTTGLNLYLFARNYNGSGDLNAKARLYYAKIWLDGVLVRDYVPCKKNGEPGLYDKVTKSVFYSKGTKPLIAGPLPGYPDEILDFVESDGNQYIDTGVEGRRGVKAMMDVAWTGFADETYQEILGAASSAGRCNLCDLYGAKPSYSYGSNYGTFDSGLKSGRTIDTVYHVITEAAAKEVLTINGYTGVRNNASEVPENFTTGLNLYLFARNYNGSGDLNAKARLYYAKIWLDGVLVRDFVPCRKDGVAGLWDRVSKAIFYSKGSKQLIADNSATLAKVGQPDSFVEYVESDGTQYIDTGVNGRAGTKAETEFSMDASTANPSYLLAAYGNNLKMYFCWLDGSGASSRYVNAQFCATNTYWGYNLSTKGTFSSEFTLLNKSIVKLTGKSESTKTVVTDKNDSYSALYAFARNNAGTVDGHSSVKLYSMKIYQTDANGDYQPKRDFVPCVKDGKAALYDSITGMIYYPQGGDLTASEDEVPISSARWIGGTVTSVADLANTANWKGMQGGLVVYGKTPVTVSGGEATLNCPVTLDEAADWSAAGIVSLASGVTIDLNGHDLTTGGFALAEGETVSILNSGTAATLTFAVADGNTAAVDVSFASNITFAKTGSGTVSLTPVKLALTVGSCFQFTGGIALDLSGTTLELADPENFTEGFVFATSDVAITGTPTAVNLPKGWKVKRSADGKTRSLAKVKGLMIIAR